MGIPRRLKVLAPVVGMIVLPGCSAAIFSSSYHRADGRPIPLEKVEQAAAENGFVPFVPVPSAIAAHNGSRNFNLGKRTWMQNHLSDQLSFSLGARGSYLAFQDSAILGLNTLDARPRFDRNARKVDDVLRSLKARGVECVEGRNYDERR